MGVNKHVLVNSKSDEKEIPTTGMIAIAILAIIALATRIVSFVLNIPFFLLAVVGVCFLIITVAPMLGYPEFAETVRTGMMLCYEEIRELIGSVR